eukprot:TRINITY_DN60869_c0_g1_i2.p2 TRINITY_DN60869_c0_g1~~TRINITY_DN60869_c0_g1_i2.p2  ORF type:complete len:139 (+),score=58.57 TRINITY_DN60869_c0_g1_i2:27-419(+)
MQKLLWLAAAVLLLLATTTTVAALSAEFKNCDSHTGISVTSVSFEPLQPRRGQAMNITALGQNGGDVVRDATCTTTLTFLGIKIAQEVDDLCTMVACPIPADARVQMMKEYGVPLSAPSVTSSVFSTLDR